MGEIGELGGKAQVRTQRYGDRKADGWILPLKKKKRTQLNHFFQTFSAALPGYFQFCFIELRLRKLCQLGHIQLNGFRFGYEFDRLSSKEVGH
ncbi:hypothetical protein FF1_038897 [Malus domestica]